MLDVINCILITINLLLTIKNYKILRQIQRQTRHNHYRNFKRTNYNNIPRID